jgi:flagellar protein FlbD
VRSQLKGESGKLNGVVSNLMSPLVSDAFPLSTFSRSVFPMITVTRLNGKPLVVNADLIRTVEENPDTTITLVNGDHIIVKEPMKEIVSRTIDYGRHLRRMTPVT